MRDLSDKVCLQVFFPKIFPSVVFKQLARRLQYHPEATIHTMTFARRLHTTDVALLWQLFDVCQGEVLVEVHTLEDLLSFRRDYVVVPISIAASLVVEGIPRFRGTHTMSLVSSASLVSSLASGSTLSSVYGHTLPLDTTCLLVWGDLNLQQPSGRKCPPVTITLTCWRCLSPKKSSTRE